MAELDKQKADFYKSLRNNLGYRLDREFARADDLPLTDEELAAIDEYWGKYKFAYPQIDYGSFKIFKNRLGRFDVRHCPGNVEYQFFFKGWEKSAWAIPFQNKAMLPILYSNAKQPRTLVRRMQNILYNEFYQPIEIEEAIDIMLNFLEKGGKGIIVKPNMRNGGHGIEVITPEDANEAVIREVMRNMQGRAFVAQEIMTQSAFTAQFNPTSVNTMRITTLLFDRKVHVLSGLIRIGKAGNTADNFCSGGSLLGIDIETGKVNQWAMAGGNVRIDRLPSGLELQATDLVVPNIEAVKETVASMHYRMPYVRMIAWDIALDGTNTPVLIECNFCGYYQMNEAVSGPVFAPLLDKMLDQWLKTFFYFEFATEQFRCREYHDRVEITEYIGENGDVIVPQRLRGKLVTKIHPQAFKGCKVSAISASALVMKNSSAAMDSIQQ